MLRDVTIVPDNRHREAEGRSVVVVVKQLYEIQSKILCSHTGDYPV